MKLFFTFVFILTLSNADYLNTRYNVCIYDVTLNYGKKGLCYTYRQSGNRYCYVKQTWKNTIPGYVYKDDKCQLYDELQKTGLSYSDFQFQQALLANLYGFFIFFLVGFLFVLQGRR